MNNEQMAPIEAFVKQKLIEDGFQESDFGVISATFPGGGSMNLTYVIAEIVAEYLSHLERQSGKWEYKDKYQDVWYADKGEPKFESYERFSGFFNSRGHETRVSKQEDESQQLKELISKQHSALIIQNVFFKQYGNMVGGLAENVSKLYDEMQKSLDEILPVSAEVVANGHTTAQ